MRAQRMAHGSGRQTIENARRLRREQTPIEARLWRMLKAGQLAGYKFRRQHAIGRYVTDFCCEEARLVIEVDGDSHGEQQEYDEARTLHLKGLGYAVLRVTNRDVMTNTDGVLELILNECRRRGR